MVNRDGDSGSVLVAMIVGAEKAGTTSVFQYLGKQQELLAHAQREMTFFSNLEQYKKG